MHRSTRAHYDTFFSCSFGLNRSGTRRCLVQKMDHICCHFQIKMAAKPNVWHLAEQITFQRLLWSFPFWMQHFNTSATTLMRWYRGGVKYCRSEGHLKNSYFCDKILRVSGVLLSIYIILNTCCNLCRIICLRQCWGGTNMMFPITWGFHSSAALDIFKINHILVGLLLKVHRASLNKVCSRSNLMLQPIVV